MSPIKLDVTLENWLKSFFFPNFLLLWTHVIGLAVLLLGESWLCQNLKFYGPHFLSWRAEVKSFPLFFTFVHFFCLLTCILNFLLLLPFILTCIIHFYDCVFWDGMVSRGVLSLPVTFWTLFRVAECEFFILEIRTYCLRHSAKCKFHFLHWGQYTQCYRN